MASSNAIVYVERQWVGLAASAVRFPFQHIRLFIRKTGLKLRPLAPLTGARDSALAFESKTFEIQIPSINTTIGSQVEDAEFH
jgi:hypothetical protein